MIALKHAFGFNDRQEGFILRGGKQEQVPREYNEILQGLFRGITDERELVRYAAKLRGEDPILTNWLCVQFILDYSEDLMPSGKQ